MNRSSSAAPIDVVVPVYNAPEDVRRCVASVIECTEQPFRLVVIDDGSTDPDVRNALRELEQRGDPRVLLLRNDRNLGFTATANRGMTLSRFDVVLLNSDTIVTRGWLEALVRCAASDASIATVTPFSNNAEICSFPRFCDNNPPPDEADAERIRAALAAAAVPTYPDLPTGVGFCMLIRRTAIESIGTFDLAFGAGYGEENDFCLRAARAGWRNALADDAFVLHTGGRSFEGRKVELGTRNLARIRARHPHYDAMVERYIAADPLRALREAALSRMISVEPTPGVLHVIHHHGGGTETHVRALIEASRNRWRHYLAVTIGDRWQVEEHRADGTVVTFGFARQHGERWRDFLAGIAGTFNVTLIHLHNISGCREGLMQALADLDIPFGYTLHDLNFACPTITFLDPEGRYCGGVTDRRACQACVAAQPAFSGIDIASWRETHATLVARAAFILAPSVWAQSMFRRYFARDDVRVIPHGIAASPATVTPGLRLAALMPEDDVPVVAVLGAIGPDKGARRVERIVELLRREQETALRIVVIGYLDVQQGPWQADDGRLTVHGRYDARDLPALLRHYKARFVFFPSAGPETFSYTLSEAWRAGMPALVPPIGALAERVAASGAGWVMSADEWADESRMLARVVSLAGPEATEARTSAAANARAIAHASTRDMADATLACYAAAVASRTSAARFERFTNARVRDSLGYQAWSPPAPAADTVSHDMEIESPVEQIAEDATLVGRFARRALAMRRTPMGRFLYRMTPTPLIDALKARLDG